MKKARNGKISRILCALVCLALSVGVFASVGSLTFSAHAEDTSIAEFVTENLSLSNGQFANVSGSAPRTPDGWTGGGIDNKGSSGVIGGVMALDSYASEKDSYKLNEDYPDEFKGNTPPDSPFGNENYPGTNRNVLFINVRPSNSVGTAYGYTSSSLTFMANRYYKIEAYVRTGNFAENTGAAIRLNGLDDDVAFININTVKDNAPDKDHNFGWERFEFYIASSSYADQTVTVSLQVGDSYTDSKDSTKTHYDPATGYAFFDNIQAYQISPADFFRMAQSAKGSSHTIVKDYSNKTTDKIVETSGMRNLNFYSAIPDENWRLTGDDLSDLTYGIYNGAQPFSDTSEEAQKYHLVSDPSSANGKYTGYNPDANETFDGDSSVLVLSSYNDGSFRSVAAGVASRKFTVERYHYYRVSAWVKAQEMSSDGNGATLALSVVRNSGDKEYEGKNLFATHAKCTGDDANLARGGYTQYSLYVQGSAVQDYEASVECWLGTPDNESSGIAIFDNVTIEEILPSVYNAHSSDTNATAVNIDTDAGVEESFRTFEDTGVANGEFYQIGEYETFEYPFAPANWSMYTPETVETEGYSTETAYLNLDSDNLISGIIPTDTKTFNQYAENFGGAYNYGDGKRNLLLLHANELTAFCYRSPAITVSANTPGTLTVELMAADIKGYGASLVLKNDKKVLATIENIGNTNDFKTFTFYIEPGATDISTVSVEVWLGNIDRKDNHTKRASGNVYVQKVAYAAFTDDTDGDSAAVKFANAKAKCDAARLNNPTAGQAAYSFVSSDFTAYDYYDSAYVKLPYDWTLTTDGGEGVRYGIFDPTRHPSDDTTVPQSFRNTEYPNNHTVLMLYNPSPASSALTSAKAMSFTAGTYYQVDVLVKVDIPEQTSINAIGATLSLSGTEFAFKDIKSTTVVTDGTTDTEAFRKYTFYIDPGSEDTTASLRIALGEGASSAKRCSGRVYINSITVTDISESLFNASVKDVETDKNNDYALIARLGEQKDDETPDDTEPTPSDNTMQWWLIPSILFAIAIVIALVGFLIRKIMEKRADKKGVVQKTASYDRAATLNREHNKNAEESEKVADVVESTDGDESYETFDDDTVKSEKAPAVKPTEPVTESTTEETTSEKAEESAPTQENADGESASEQATETEAQTPATGEQQSPVEEKIEPKNDSFIDQFDD